MKPSPSLGYTFGTCESLNRTDATIYQKWLVCPAGMQTFVMITVMKSCSPNKEITVAFLWGFS